MFGIPAQNGAEIAHKVKGHPLGKGVAAILPIRAIRRSEHDHRCYLINICRKIHRENKIVLFSAASYPIE